jgi:hypothetical protein
MLSQPYCQCPVIVIGEVISGTETSDVQSNAGAADCEVITGAGTSNVRYDADAQRSHDAAARERRRRGIR